MSTTTRTSSEEVRDALRRASCESYLDDVPDTERYLNGVARTIDEFRSAYALRFNETPDPFELLRRNPDKGAAFIQWIAGESMPVDLYIMIWRILAGAEILTLKFNYLKDQTSQFEVVLEPLPGTPSRNESDTYRISEFWNTSLLAEFRMLAFMGKPYLVGSFLPIAGAR